MPDNNLLDKVITHINRYANDREIVMYGNSNQIKQALNDSDFSVKKIFTSSTDLLNSGDATYIKLSELKNNSDKYYVVLPFFLPDGGIEQRKIMKDFGYKPGNDYVFYPDDLTNQNNEDVFIRLINELHLERNKRMAVWYFFSLGDMYALCSSFRYAEERLKKEYIILYITRQEEILSWFDQSENKLKTYKITREEEVALRDLDLKKKYSDYFVSWECGDNEFRALTCNTSPDFMGNSELPHFPQTDIKAKYKDYIVPNKTVMILPEAQALASPPAFFWNFAAEIFRYMGYEVVFNADSSKESKVYNGKCLLVPLGDVIPFANECGLVFGLRSGLFDVISSSTAQMIIFSTLNFTSLDKVYKISNDDNRIRTIYFRDNDPYFEHFYPIYCIKEYFKKDAFDLFKLIPHPHFNSNKQNAEEIFGYKCVVTHNRYPNNFKKYKIDKFVNIEYLYEISGDALNFAINELDLSLYRLDCVVFANDCVVAKFNDYQLTYISLPLSSSAEYYIRTYITDKNTYNQETFDTEKLNYAARIPTRKEELSQCDDMQSYAIALSNFMSELCILIVSRDAHTRPNINKYTNALRFFKLLTLKTDLESTYRYSYIAVIDEGTVVQELLSKDQAISYEYRIGDNKVYLESSGYNASHSDLTSIKININDISCAVDHRGLNIVVWDKKKNIMIDSVAFDSFNRNTAYRYGTKNDKE